MKPLAGIGARFMFAAIVAWAATCTVGNVAAGQEPAAPAEAAPGKSGAAPTPPETKADEPVEAPAQPEAQAEPPSSAGEEGEPKAETESAEPVGRPWIRGSFNAGFDGVFSDNDSDIDLDQTLRLRIDPPQYPWLHVRGAVRVDEDLNSESYYKSVVRDFDDTTHSGVRANLLHLYVDIDDLWGDSVLRLGRQRISESPLYNRIDGIYFKQRLQGWEWYLFGGARASNYVDAHEDAVLGGGAAFQATPTTRVALDAFYADEDRDDDDEVRVRPIYDFFDLQFPRRVHSDVDDNHVSVSLWQWFPPNVSLFGRFSLQNGDPDDLVLSLNGQYPDWDVAYEVTYHRQMEENDDLVNDLTAFYRILGEYEEFDDLLLAVHKPLNEMLTLSLEGQFHGSDASGDESWANRDFQRYAAILSADELVPTVDASVALEYWDVDEGEGTWAVTGEVSKSWERIKLTLGADYERYEDRVTEYNPWMYVFDRVRQAIAPSPWPVYNPVVFVFDTYVVETHENVYSFYGKVQYELSENQELSLKTTYEEDDGPDSPYWRVQAGYTINF